MPPRDPEEELVSATCVINVRIKTSKVHRVLRTPIFQLICSIFYYLHFFFLSQSLAVKALWCSLRRRYGGGSRLYKPYTFYPRALWRHFADKFEIVIVLRGASVRLELNLYARAAFIIIANAEALGDVRRTRGLLRAMLMENVCTVVAWVFPARADVNFYTRLVRQDRRAVTSADGIVERLETYGRETRDEN